MRPDLPGIGHEFVEANGMRFSVATAGSGDRLALCLHGFPECWYSWHHQMPFLAERGYRVWAPDLRGYGESSRPPRVQDYAIEKLLGDIADNKRHPTKRTACSPRGWRTKKCPSSPATSTTARRR
jgi:alpha-beta hydrolase superfamily lysophospholipase